MKAGMPASCRALQPPCSSGLAPTRSVPQFPQGAAAHGDVQAAGAAWCWGGRGCAPLHPQRPHTASPRPVQLPQHCTNLI